MAVDRTLLPYTWTAFFERFDRLTEIQEKAVPEILAGRDVLVCSATASGKTEAYAAPVVESVRHQRWSSGSVMIISPTRALANDLHRRLQTRMDAVRVTFGRRTGEYKERIAGHLPQVVVTTPESLDSMLARRPHAVAGTKVVVIDEIHVLDGTPRGDQLRILLHRLDAVCSTPPQRIAASATVDDMSGLARRHLRDAVVVAVDGVRRVTAKRFDGSHPEDYARHLDELTEAGYRKVLVFCNSRSETERLSVGVRDRSRFRDAVFTHHGSLAKRERERTERQFLAAPAAVCFATMTLEMGIDIGTVDYVLLASAPPDVASLFQRIGRGGRRGDVTRLGYVAENDFDAYHVEEMLRAGVRGELLASPAAFRPSVIVQQILVLAGSETYVTAEVIAAALPESIRKTFDVPRLRTMLDHLVQRERLERGTHESYVLAEDSENRYDRGALHSNIDDDIATEVVDRVTGDVVGHVLTPDESRLQLGGSGRHVVQGGAGRLLTDRSRDSSPAKFHSRGKPSVSFRQARRFVESIGVSKTAMYQFTEAGRVVLLHGLGTFGSLLLVDVLERTAKHGVVEDPGPYSLRLKTKLDDIPQIAADTCRAFVRGHVDKLARFASVGPFHRDLPEDIQIDSLTAIFGSDEIRRFIAAAHVEDGERATLARPEIAIGI